MKLAHHTRWTIHAMQDGGLRVCRGVHEHGSECVWEEFIPRPPKHQPAALSLEAMSTAPRDGRFILALSKYGWDIICSHKRDEWWGMNRGGEDGDEYYLGWIDLGAAPWGFFCWDALPDQKER